MEHSTSVSFFLFMFVHRYLIKAILPILFSLLAFPVYLFRFVSPQIKIDSFLPFQGLQGQCPNVLSRKRENTKDIYKYIHAASGSRASEVKCPLASVYFQHWLGLSLPGTIRPNIKLNKGEERRHFQSPRRCDVRSLGPKEAEGGVGGGEHTRGSALH